LEDDVTNQEFEILIRPTIF